MGRTKAGGRHVPRTFLTQESIALIGELNQQGYTVSAIAARFNISERAVKDKLSEIFQNQANEWLQEEIDTLVKLYKSGLRKPSDFKNHLPNKANWMIRNKIKLLEKNGLSFFDHKPAVEAEPIEFNEFDDNTLSEEYPDFRNFTFKEE